MKENIPNLENLFKSGIDQHKEMPPEEVWNALDTKLDKANALHKKKQQIKKWSSLILLLLIGFIIFEMNPAGFRGVSGNKISTGKKTLDSNTIITKGNTKQDKPIKTKFYRWISRNTCRPAILPGINSLRFNFNNGI